MLEDYSKVDASLANMSGDVGQFRWDEDSTFLIGMSETFTDTMFYGTKAETNKFPGLTERYDGTPQTENKKLSTYNIVDAGGSGSDCTSMWLIVHGAKTFFGIYPKGSQAGWHKNDKSKQNTETVQDADGNNYEAYVTHFKFDGGIVVKDWRYVVRIGSIDMGEITADASAGANLINQMIIAINRIPNLKMGKPVFYCNRDIKTYLELQANSKANVSLRLGEEGGAPFVKMRGIPIKTCDALINTEAAV